MNKYFQITAVMLFICLSLISATAQQNEGSISGVVVDQNGAVMPRVTITAVNKETKKSFTTTTSDSGNFRLDHLPAGVYDVKAEAAGFKSTTIEDVKLNVGQTSSLTITFGIGGLSKYGRIEGKVLTSTQKPVVGAKVFVKDGDGTELSGETDVHGSYSIARVGPGKKVEVWVEQSGQYLPKRKVLELKARDVKTQDFVQQPSN